MIKIKLPNSPYYFLGIRISSNGNKTAYFERAGKKVRVQTNGNMPKTHGLNIDSEYSEDDLIWVRKELVNYLFNIGQLTNTDTIGVI